MSRLDDFRNRLADARQGRAWKLARKPLLAIGVLVALILVEWGLVLWLGIVNAIVYSFVFLVGAAFLPFFIALAGADLPLNAAIGRVHILLGAIAFNHHYLVDMGDKWEWCPGEEERVYIEGEWYNIDGGFENRSVLGWRPFGILRFKDDDTYREIRADTKAERDRRGRGTTTDGGVVEITRGGYDEAEKPLKTGTDGIWVVDLKRLFARGVRKFGDVELVETAEEIIERGEVTQSTFEGWRPLIGTIMGLFLGCGFGYMLFFAG